MYCISTTSTYGARGQSQELQSKDSLLLFGDEVGCQFLENRQGLFALAEPGIAGIDPRGSSRMVLKCTHPKDVLKSLDGRPVPHGYFQAKAKRVVDPLTTVCAVPVDVDTAFSVEDPGSPSNVQFAISHICSIAAAVGGDQW